MTDDTVTVCECCNGRSVATPVEVNNRPGLPQINYRIGTHSSYKETMLARLSSSDVGALSGLRTRSDDDFSIAFLDAWATLADVLTFYQERIANESYLRTATERRSLLELARLIGYAPRPGIAATVKLAFTLEEVPNGPEEIVIPAGTRVQSIPGPDELPQTFETVEAIKGRLEWNSIRPKLSKPQVLSIDATEIWVEGTNHGLNTGDRLLIVKNRQLRLLRILSVAAPDNAGRSQVELLQQASLFDLSTTPLPTLPNDGVYAFRVRAALFGHIAPDWRALPDTVKHGYGAIDTPPLNSDWPDNLLPLPNEKLIKLDSIYNQIKPVKRGFVAVVRPKIDQPGIETIIGLLSSVSETSVSNYAISGRVTLLEVDILGTNRVAPSTMEQLRQTTVYAQSEKLDLADMIPIREPLETKHIKLDKQYPGLRRGQLFYISEVGPGIPPHGEFISLAESRVVDGVTEIILQRNLEGSYQRRTVTINANVAPATHGETISEILGSGDATRLFQRFTLRQPPLTFLSTANSEGASSTLELRVNDLLWHEIPTLYKQGPNNHVYASNLSDDGKTSVQFGDGKIGARLPSGIENVRATYRKGIGSRGLVRAGQISLLQTRPLGVRSVTNPLESRDAQDPESRDELRANTPLTVMTLDRIVSLRDYEDFARAFPGIAKALATWTWDGERRAVFVTVAGINGAVVQSDGDLYANLLAAMQRSSDPYTPLRLVSYRKIFFRLAAKILIDPDFLTEKITKAIRISLQAEYGFAKRMLGQPVFMSEIVATIQAVPGVVAVDLDLLHRTLQPAALQHRLLAGLPQAGQVSSTSHGAEMLMIDSDGIRIEVL